MIHEGIEWFPMATAPRDRDVRLIAWIGPSEEAARNGSLAHWHEAVGRCIAYNPLTGYELWSGILGGSPDYWREI